MKIFLIIFIFVSYGDTVQSVIRVLEGGYVRVVLLWFTRECRLALIY